jgi:hypothetical protein
MRSNSTRMTVLVAALSLALGSVAVAALKSGTSITSVKVVTSTGSSVETQSRSYVDLPGAATSITVPSGQKALILARFTAASQCGSLNPDDDGCNVRVLIGGIVADPVSAGPFDTAECCSASSNGDSLESHAIDRSRGPLGPGTYPVKVQWVADAENDFQLWGWHLTVERVKSSG